VGRVHQKNGASKEDIAESRIQKQNTNAPIKKHKKKIENNAKVEK